MFADFILSKGTRLKPPSINYFLWQKGLDLNKDNIPCFGLPELIIFVQTLIDATSVAHKKSHRCYGYVKTRGCQNTHSHQHKRLNFKK